MEKISILLLEDDPNLGFMVEEHLIMKGYSVKRVNNGEEGLREYAQYPYQLILADVMMPKMDGFTFVRKIRKTDKDVPIIFLTAKSMKEDSIEGFKSGCDDYIIKPFSIEELFLRIEAVLRRSGRAIKSDAPGGYISFGKFRFNPVTMQLQSGTKSETLTAKEAGLLKLLLENLNKELDRTEALTRIWGEDTIFTARSMDVYITKLRKHLKPDPSVKILNIHGKGYKLVVGE